MKKSKADSSSLETSLCLLFLYMLNVFSDPVSIISWFSFVCLFPLPLLRARILCLVLSPLLPSLWLMIVLHLSLIDLTCPWLISPVLCSVVISSSVLSSSLSDSLLSILMCLLCFSVVPLLDFWILLAVLFILLLVRTEVFWCQISCQRLHRWTVSFHSLCQTSTAVRLLWTTVVSVLDPYSAWCPVA